MRDQTNNLWPPEGNCWKIKEEYCEDVRRNMRAVVIEEAHLERCRMASI